jgi:hypothetical protein
VPPYAPLEIGYCGYCKEDAVCFCELGTEVWPADCSPGVVILCNLNAFMVDCIFYGKLINILL